MSIRSTRYRVRIGWAGRNAGVALVGVAKVAPLANSAGYDRIGYPFTPAYVGPYDDVSGPGLYSVKSFTVTRGRPSRWDNIIAGEGVVTLHDKGDGRYNPDNAGGPLFGQVRPMRPIKIEGLLEDGITYEDVFNGWLDESTDTPDIGTQEASFNFKDLLMWLDGDNPVIAPTGPTTVGAVIGKILDWYGWTNPTLRSLAAGSAIPNFVDADGTRSGLQLIGDLLAVDLGLFFHSRKGVATYYDRYEYSRRVSIGTFQSSTAVVLGTARKNIRNRATNTYTGGTAGAQTVEDAASRGEFGPLKWNDVSSPYFGSDANALAQAQQKVAEWKDPIPPVWTYQVGEGFTGDFDRIVKADLIDRLVIQNPANTDYHIEKISHKALTGVFHSADLVLSKRAARQPALVGVSLVAPLTTSAGYDVVAY